jgi:hypothetical protein
LLNPMINIFWNNEIEKFHKESVEEIGMVLWWKVILIFKLKLWRLKRKLFWHKLHGFCFVKNVVLYIYRIIFIWGLDINSEIEIPNHCI